MKKIKLGLVIIISMLVFGNVNAASIEEIYPLDLNTLEVVTSSDVVFPNGEVYGELRLVKDISVIDSIKDSSESNKITLYLDKDIQANSSYSIISVGLAEGTIEFSLLEDIEGEYHNANTLNEEKIIERINIVSPTVLEVFYNYDIQEGMYDFKVLNEIEVGKMNSLGNNVLSVDLITPLETLTPYIFMVSYLEDAYGIELGFDELLNDFTTPNYLSEKTIDSQVSEENNNDLSSAGTESGNIVTEVDKNEDLEQVAQNVNKIPQTGPTLWITLLLTFVIAGLVLLFRTRES